MAFTDELVYYRTPAYDEKLAAGAVVHPELMDKAWPQFMREDPVSNERFPLMFQHYGDLQTFVVWDGAVIGKIQCIPVVWNGDPATLPEAGWRWALQSGTDNAVAGIEPNTLCAIAIAIRPDMRGRGLSTVFLEHMAGVGREQGFAHLIAPVRPSQKTDYPLIPMTDYITWTRDDGLPFDAWLRVHVRYGGEIIGVTERALQVPGTRAQWEAWTGLQFQSRGQYVVPFALNPVIADIEADEILYTEPNVWIVHRL